MAEKGKNKALEKSAIGQLLAAYAKEKRSCVFISHKKEDEDKAKAIGDYIMSQGLDIYLDLYDCELQEAVSVENDKLIVESIKRGIKTSTHLLCLVSDKTKLSWWVPFEVGVAGENKIQITTLKLKDVEDIPSFLKTEAVLLKIQEFFDYVMDIYSYGGLLHKKDFQVNDHNILAEYIDE